MIWDQHSIDNMAILVSEKDFEETNLKLVRAQRAEGVSNWARTYNTSLKQTCTYTVPGGLLEQNTEIPDSHKGDGWESYKIYATCEDTAEWQTGGATVTGDATLNRGGGPEEAEI